MLENELRALPHTTHKDQIKMDEKIDNRPETIRYFVENLSITLHEIKAKFILKN